ncbi:hypothetical protein [Brachybacterium sp. FME24]|uniref:hypothetical protein n=1 Tax=Brachybacterium sp. FME24 TaxID=2742605 RepID=UPI0018683862|nr:hypothetical protein [Brachybacterium sp. FME24]
MPPIPHAFVLDGDAADDVTSIADGLQQIQPLVTQENERVRESPRPPKTHEQI